MAVTNDPDQDNFSNVSWSEHVHDQTSRPDPPGEGDNHDLEGLSSGAGHDPQGLSVEKLDCTVGQPIKENDGTKDAFVSYLITTYVCLPLPTTRVDLTCLPVS